ncbi:MAG: ABC transporter permease [Spirochaetes bacterium]|jgi:ribose/xylose/arabinose/galactoside ABC-type transport system permease subunit|nr:ABC transporter permease [Spirochaetota bacterium]
MKLKLNHESYKQIIGPLAAFLLILLFNYLFTPGFFDLEIKDGQLFGSIVDIFNRGAPVMIIALGMTLVYATGGIDLSVGSVMAISGAVAAFMIRPGYISGVLEYGTLPPVWQVILIPLIVAAIAGLWNGVLVTYLKIQPIIATLILMVAGRGIAQLITKGNIIIFRHENFEVLGSGNFLGLPVPVVMVIVIALLMHFLTRKTALGLFIEAVGSNPTASYFIGINSRRIKLLVYVFCGICAGFAGLIITADIKGADANNCGLWFELDAIAAVIIGGTVWGGRYTLAGTLLGALIIQSITTTILSRGIAPEQILVYKAIVVLSVTLIQSGNMRKMIVQLFNSKKKRVSSIANSGVVK